MLTLAFAAPASAGELTSRSLPRGCVEDTDGVIALACDPAGAAGAPLLTLGTTSGRRLDGAEALQPGEKLVLTWSRPSPRAVLYVYVASAAVGTHGVIVNLRQGAEHVEVTVGDGGSLLVSPGGAVPAASRPDVTWDPRSARAAARGVLRAVRHMERSVAAVQTLCASLPGGVRDYFTSGTPADDEACLQTTALFIHGDENVPGVVSTHASGLSVSVRGRRAVMRTRLVHRYRPQSIGDPRRIALNAQALLVRDATGVWRLATPGKVLRRPAVSLMLSAGVVIAAAVPVLNMHTLDPGTVGLPPNLSIMHTYDRIEKAFPGGPLPAEFSVAVDSGHPNIHVAGGVVEVYNGDDEPKPIRGATARLDADGLTVFLPRKASIDDVEFSVDVNDVRYGDTLALP